MSDLSKPPLLGATLLRRHIDDHHRTDDDDGSISAFCAAHGLDRVHVSRVLKNKRRRINVNLIRDIHRATGGEVPWWSWTTDGVPPDGVPAVGVSRTTSDRNESSISAGYTEESSAPNVATSRRHSREVVQVVPEAS